MNKTIAALLITVVLSTCQIAFSKEVRILDWKDLIPADLLTFDPYKGLNEEQRGVASWIVTLFENLPERTSETEEIFEMVDQGVAELKEANIDIYNIMERRKKLNRSVATDLDGQKVSIPGYLLPLEMAGSSVTEFLLVPYLGACIHSPPPPPNQIVHVTADEKKGYKSKALFDPVMVTGIISIKSLVKNLFLVDGSSNISVGYIMQASKIKPYKK